jgi:hypothetical protein
VPRICIYSNGLHSSNTVCTRASTMLIHVIAHSHNTHRKPQTTMHHEKPSVSAWVRTKRASRSCTNDCQQYRTNKRNQSRVCLARSTEIQNFETFLLCTMNNSDLNFKGLRPYERIQLLGRSIKI